MDNITFEIFKPAKSAMQSGKAKQKWQVKPISSDQHRKVNQLMGWTSSSSTTQSQILFEFNSKEEAIKFVEEKGFNYKIREPKKSSFKVKSYAANFTS